MLKKGLYKTLQLLPSSLKFIIVISLILITISLMELILYSSSNNNSDSFTVNENSKTLNFQIPKNLNFAGEIVPHADFNSMAAMEKELLKSTFWQAQILLLHKRANRWFPLIEPILKQNNIPDDFKYIALIESQLTNIVSPQGAAGFWQLIIPTAKDYGLEINDEVDERYNVTKSTEAACKYFNEAYKQFNNWTLVAASYNLGMTGVQAQLEKQKVKNYYDLNLTQETGKYIFRLLSMKEIISRPKVYGFSISKKDLYPVVLTKKLVIDSTIHDLAGFAKKQGVDYLLFKLFNPWLKSNSLTNNEKKKYKLEIPKGNVNIYDWDINYGGKEVIANKDSISLINTSAFYNDSIVTKE